MKTTHFLLFVFLLFTKIAVAQDQKKIDSLLLELKHADKDTNQVILLVNIWRATINNTPEKALKYADQIIGLSQDLAYDKGVATGHQRKAIAYSYLGDYESSNKEYRKSIVIYKKHNSIRLIGRMLFNVGINQKQQSIYDSAFYYNELAKGYLTKAGDSIGLGAVLDENAGIHMEKGHFSLSLESALKAANIFDKLKDSVRLADAMVKVADNYDSTGDSELAEKYYKECLGFYKKTNDLLMQSSVYRKLGIIEKGKKNRQEDSAIFYFSKAIEVSKEIKTPLDECLAMSSYGDLLFDMEQYTEAEHMFTNALEIASEIKSGMVESSSLIDIGKVHFAQKKYVSGREKTKKGLHLAIEQQVLQNIQRAYLNLYKSYKEQNESVLALEHYEKYKRISDSIYNIEEANKRNELKTIYETEKKEVALALQKEEIKTLNKEIQINNLRKKLYGIGMFSFISISGLLFFGFRQRMKKNRIEQEKREAIYKQEIEFKKKELASQTLHLVQKNSFIKELKENLERIKSSPELFKIEFRRIVMLLKRENASDKDWKVFKSYFSQVHDSFDKKLKEIYKEITEKEIRLAAFLRMNLSTKEIASMLNVMPDSILKSKYRLKKKLGLSKEKDLKEYLETL